MALYMYFQFHPKNCEKVKVDDIIFHHILHHISKYIDMTFQSTLHPILFLISLHFIKYTFDS